MEHTRTGARGPAAFTVWLTALALAPIALVHGQGADPYRDLQPSTPTEAVQHLSPEGLDRLTVAPESSDPASADVRLDRLETQMQALQAAAAQNNADLAPPNPDSRPTLRMGGQIQIDYLFIGQNAANRASVGEAEDVFGFRRARLTGSGRAYEVVEYSIGFDFALSGRPSFLDNLIEVTDLPVLGNVRVGHYFEPFSLERVTQVRYHTFSERSLADTFAPSRNLGIMAHDTIGDDELGTWAIGWFRSNSDVYGDDSADEGGNAVTGRLTRVYFFDGADDRSYLHLGAAFTHRAARNRQISFESFPEARAGSPGSAGIPPFVETGLIRATSDQRFGLELARVHGPLYVQGEYIATRVDQLGGPPLHFHGAYGFVSYFLTGEHRTYNRQMGIMDRVYPFENFFRVRTDEGIERGAGAWEIAARWSFIDLDSQNIEGGTLNDLTLSLNWHLNPYTRVRWEYIHALLDRAPVGNSAAQIFGMRFDIDF
jgi:phosphate-selective porin OprO/OprP